MKPGSCTVCSHPRRAEIDAAALAGAPLRTLAEQFSRSKNTLQKHISQHIPDSVQKAIDASDARDVDAGDAILRELDHLKSEARRLQSMAEKGRDVRAAIAALRELREAIELTAKIVGQLHENEINLSVHVDDATATKMAQTFLARRSRPVIMVQAKPVDAGIQPVALLQVTGNEATK